MGFLAAVTKFIAMEELRAMGQEVLAAGRTRFAEELASGKEQKEAARIAAKFMLKLAGKRSVLKAKAAGGNAIKTARTVAGKAAGKFRR